MTLRYTKQTRGKENPPTFLSVMKRKRKSDDPSSFYLSLSMRRSCVMSIVPAKRSVAFSPVKSYRNL